MAKKPIKTDSKTTEKITQRQTQLKDLIRNRKALHDYAVVTAYEAGIALCGTEVKSCRLAQIALNDAYARVMNGEVFLFGMHISPYEFGNRFNHEAVRPRKLLLNRVEIRRMSNMVKEKGYTLIPLKLYLKNGKVKVELGVCKGKNVADKRDTLKRKAHEMETKRAMAFVKK